MKSLNLLQLLPSLQSGGVEQGTIDVANFLSENKVNSFIVSNGGPLVKKLNRNVQHITILEECLCLKLAEKRVCLFLM